MESNLKTEFKTPILFLVFNRPENTEKVFKQIRKAKPRELYVAADGPRRNNTEDNIKCEQVKKIVQNIDWSCKIKTLFQEKNLGCKNNITTSINWFFDNVAQGIILEDDCLPADSFFPFCDLMLNKYQNEEKVMMISGTNYLFNKYNLDSYFFSKLVFIWGWATWKRAWEKYSTIIENPNYELFSQIYKNIYYSNMLKEMLRGCLLGKIDTWDIQWVYTLLNNDGYSIIPYKNQVSNIGSIGLNANIKYKSPFIKMKARNLIVSKIKTPKKIIIDQNMDINIMSNIQNKLTKPSLVNYLYKLITLNNV